MNRIDTDNLSFQDWKNIYEEARGHDAPEFGKDKVPKKKKNKSTKWLILFTAV